ncbi:MAG: HNH endonuclease [bacterium]
MNIERLKQIVSESNNITEVCVKYYGNKHYGNRQTLKKYIDEYCIDVGHFGKIQKSNRQLGKFKKIPLSEILIFGSTYDTTLLKKRLYGEGLKQPICELCGQDENWQGKKMSLILDHINGVNNDHRLENLQIVCPNCNATLSTHSGKNSKRTKKRYHEKTHLEQAVHQRQVKRPPLEQLLKEIEELGYSGTGRKYGVSDNAIRKWKKFYEKHE